MIYTRIKPPLGVQPNRNHFLARGLVGCWLMNEGSGNKVYDLSGNRNHGDFSGDVSIVPAKFGNGIYFAGVSDGITVPHSASQSPISGQLTISVWAYVDATSPDGYATLVAKGLPSAAGGSYALMYTPATNRVYAFVRYADDSTYLSTYWAVASCLDKWRHYVLTCDNIVLRVYLNGVLCGTPASYTSGIYNGTGSVSFGQTIGITTRDLKGSIDNGAIWNRALTAQEVMQLYMEPFAMFRRERLEIYSSIPADAGYMTLNTRYWG